MTPQELGADISATPAQTSLLNLTQPQVDIIAAHLQDAIGKICSIAFDGCTDEKLRDRLMSHAFEHGRRVAFTSMIQYDQSMMVEADRLKSEAAAKINPAAASGETQTTF